MKQEALRRWQLERWISLVRLIAVPWAILEVAFLSDYPSGGYEAAAWVTTAVLAIGAVAFFLVGRRGAPERLQPAICLAGLLFDTGVIWAYALVFTFGPGTPIRELLFFPVVEAALRYGLRGGLLMPAAQAPILLATEWWRSDRFAPPEFTADHVTFPLGLQFAMGGIIGWLVNRLARETAAAQERASEAEALRDRLGHRVDLLDAANRCARALGSSLEIEEAFRGVHPRAARADPVRPDGDRAHRRRRRPRDRRGRRRGRDGVPAGHQTARGRLAAARNHRRADGWSTART